MAFGGTAPQGAFAKAPGSMRWLLLDSDAVCVKSVYSKVNIVLKLETISLAT